jgi:light-regulated signal transduction histidine kinase (bacteriophytochrome)
MSRAILRHVSVMYTSYLKNMRVHATMVIPLMKGGRLWGLISCMHHAAPLHVPYRTRTATELLAHLVSSLMVEQEDRDTAAYRDRMKAAIAGLDRQMTQALEYQQGLCRGEFTLLGWLDAPGAALVTQDGILLFGDTPTEPQVRGIIGWLNEQDVTVPVFATDRLPELYPPAEMFRTFASGLLTARLVQRETEFVMWFRPEQVQTVAWAGDPTKPVQVDVVDGEARLTPRMSFELWKQEVQGRSAPWLDCEIEAAAVLRRAIAEVVLLRLNESLRQSNAELDSFAYAAAHDLKEPLRGIHNFAHFLKRSADSKLTEEEQGRIQTIMQLTRRMDDLTDALLHYSRIGQTELLREKLDLNEVLERVLELLSARLVETGTVVSIPRRLPPVETDRISLTGILTNLVVNAIKYNDRPAGDRGIEIGWRDEVGRQVFYVRDNGIGIAERHLEHVFRIFRRLHGRSEYGGGSGAGLTIARRAAERLGGRLWAESPGAGLGTTFLFTPCREREPCEPSDRGDRGQRRGFRGDAMGVATGGCCQPGASLRGCGGDCGSGGRKWLRAGGPLRTLSRARSARPQLARYRLAGNVGGPAQQALVAAGAGGCCFHIRSAGDGFGVLQPGCLWVSDETA